MKDDHKQLLKIAIQSSLLVVLIIIMTGFINSKGLVKIWPVFGYGGGGGGASSRYPVVETPIGTQRVDVNAINYEMTLKTGKAGFYERTFIGGNRIELYIPRKTIEGDTTIDIFLIGGNTFDINAVGGQRKTGLSKDMIAVFYAPLPANSSNLNAYHYNEDALKWELVPRNNVEFSNGVTTIYTKYFGRYTISSADLSRARIFPSNTFVRDGQGRIYIITDTGKRHIRSLAEYFSYGVVDILQVNEAELSLYSDLVVDVNRYFAPNTFVKDNRGRIYLIDNGVKKHIRTIVEFQNYRVKELINVDETEIAFYEDVY